MVTMNASACLFCNSSRVLQSGPREGALWCLVKRVPVAADVVCQSFAPRSSAGDLLGGTTPLVKSGPKAHF